MSQHIGIFLGERRRLTVHITADGETFAIQNPRYELTKVESGIVEDSGAPMVQNHDLICTISPQDAGRYQLDFTFEIAGEIIKKRVGVYVSP